LDFDFVCLGDYDYEILFVWRVYREESVGRRVKLCLEEEGECREEREIVRKVC